MYISSGRRFVFVHIPKTGGTSMTRALESRAMADDLPIGDTPKARQRRRRLKGIDSAGRLWKHSTLADIDGLVAKSFIDDALVVSMVRNPWDRVFSLYTWSRMQRFDHPLVRLSRDTDFSGFLNAPLCAAALKARPYAHYVTDCSGQERDCLWIRLEHWQEDAEPLWDHLGFRLDLPHCNASRRASDYRTAYGLADADHLGVLCREDIERFGYSF